MTQEKALVTWKEIAAALNVSEKTAKHICKECKVPLMRFGKRVAVWPKDLQESTREHLAAISSF